MCQLAFPGCKTLPDKQSKGGNDYLSPMLIGQIALGLWSDRTSWQEHIIKQSSPIMVALGLNNRKRKEEPGSNMSVKAMPCKP